MFRQTSSWFGCSISSHISCQKSITQNRINFFFVRGTRHCEWLLEILNLHLAGLLGKRDARKCVLFGRLTKHCHGCNPVRKQNLKTVKCFSNLLTLHIYTLRNSSASIIFCIALIKRNCHHIKKIKHLMSWLFTGHCVYSRWWLAHNPFLSGPRCEDQTQHPEHRTQLAVSETTAQTERELH